MRTFVILFLVAVAAIRLSIIGFLELMPDEAYYYMWSERLDWSYYSKGPGVAALMHASTAFFGISEFGLRFFSPVLGLGTALLLTSLARRMYGNATALWTAVLVSVIPIFNVGGILMTIDPPSIFFWVASMVCVWLALERSPGGRVFWVLAGFSVALGFLCKYTNALQLLSVAIALLWVPRWRGELRRGGFWTMCAVACLGAIPPLIWNANHAWITTTHLIERGGFDSNGFKPTAFLEYLGAQALVFSPLIFIGLMIGLLRGWKEARGHKPGRAERARFLLAFTLPILAFYTILALRRPGEPNWTALAYPSLCVLAAMLWHERATVSRGAGIFAVVALLLGLVGSVVIIDTDIARRFGITWWEYKKDPSGRLRGWIATADTVAAVRKQVEKDLGEKVFLIAGKYQLAAELNFYLPDRRIEQPGHPPVYLPETQEIQNQFSFWGRYDEFSEPVAAAGAPAPKPGDPPANEMPELMGENKFIGRSALFFTDDPFRRPPSPLEQSFEEWKVVGRYDIRRRGQPLRTLTFFVLKNYQGMSL
jgi:4-amino-4-deoxy-L-arabinose transferase-like glycosyltransferase